MRKSKPIEVIYYLGLIFIFLYAFSMRSIHNQKSNYRLSTPSVHVSMKDKNTTLTKPNPYHCGDTPYELKIKEYQELIQLNSDELRYFLKYQKQLQEYIKHCNP